MDPISIAICYTNLHAYKYLKTGISHKVTTPLYTMNRILVWLIYHNNRMSVKLNLIILNHFRRRLVENIL